MASLTTDAEQNITGAVEDGVSELSEGQDAIRRKMDASASRFQEIVEDGVSGLSEGQDAIMRKIDASTRSVDKVVEPHIHNHFHIGQQQQVPGIAEGVDTRVVPLEA